MGLHKELSEKRFEVVCFAGEDGLIGCLEEYDSVKNDLAVLPMNETDSHENMIV